jgi:hypothetical protein
LGYGRAAATCLGERHFRVTSIEDPELIERILAHRAAPPQESLMMWKPAT